MRRHLFNFAAAASLALLLVTVVLWVRSYRVEDTVSRGGWDASLGWRQTCIGIYSGFGNLYPWYKPDDPSGAKLSASGISLSWSWTQAKASPAGNWFGPPPVAVFRVSYWKLAVLTAALPFLWWWRFKSRAPQPGECPTCYYNLTGNTSGVCPECGTPVAGKAAVKA